MDVCRTGGTEAVAGNCWGHATQGVGAGTGWSPRDTGIPGVCTCSEQAGSKAGGNWPQFLCAGLTCWFGAYTLMEDTHTHTHLIALLQLKVFWRRVTGESEALTAGAATV